MNDKVMLRELREDDAERMLEWMHDDSVMRWLQFDGKSKTIEDARHFISNAFNDTANIHRAITTDDGVYRGTISLKNITDKDAELAVAMCRDSIGKGYGTLVIGEMLSIAFEDLQRCIEHTFRRILRPPDSGSGKEALFCCHDRNNHEITYMLDSDFAFTELPENMIRNIKVFAVIIFSQCDDRTMCVNPCAPDTHSEQRISLVFSLPPHAPDLRIMLWFI